MQIDEFRRILTTFADEEANVDLRHGTLVVQVREELIEATVSSRAGDLVVEEHGEELSAAAWLVKRVARLPVLADRILSYVQEVPNFVTTAGHLVDSPDLASHGDRGVAVTDVSRECLSLLDRHLAGSTTVTYLTSDAGEGKTSLIRQLARAQAEAYSRKKTDWLLVPIPLGGRTFLRFDDVVIAALVNRLRFQLLYYESFIELVRMGVIVPAFDGFEEMIVESSSGEAVSALGNLVRSLAGSGTILIAARKAYFDYHSLRTQARLFDAIGHQSVVFTRLSLERWRKAHFLDYSRKRIPNAEQVYQAVAERLRPEHPLLTRAVLVRRLIDVAVTLNGVSELLERIGNEPQNYFFQFVNALVEREAGEKWIDKSGEPHQRLLSVEEHHELLGMVALEMWRSASSELRKDVLGVIAEVFCESKGKAPVLARQIGQRLLEHAMLVTGRTTAGALAFDHEEFEEFYLGEALGALLVGDDEGELRAVLLVGVLSLASADQAVLKVMRSDGDVNRAIARLQALCSRDSRMSVIRENCGLLVLGLAEGVENVSVAGMNFPEEALRGRSLKHLTVEGGHFQPTSLAGTRLEECRFVECRFERLELAPRALLSARMSDCEVGSLVLLERDQQLYDPISIRAALVEAGIKDDEPSEQLPEAREMEWRLRLVETLIRIFMRATQVNERAIRKRFGTRASDFFDRVLPDLLKYRIVEEVPYQGGGVQLRFRLTVPMTLLQAALEESKGDYKRFLEAVSDS